jgi:hypothetical protein
MLDLPQLSAAQKSGDQLVASLTDDEKTILVAYCDLVTSEVTKMGRERQATTSDLVRNAMLVGVSLGVKINISNSQIWKR